jgi:aldose 1-epimerase
MKTRKQFASEVIRSAFILILFISCNTESAKKVKEETIPGITRNNWGETDGKQVYIYTLTNKNGVQVKISNYGGVVTSWMAPDKNGIKSSIVLGFDSLSGYLAKPPYFGALIGRYGNRIANGRFRIGNTFYTLAVNNGKNHLHGGNKGFDKVIWDVAPFIDSVASLTLKYFSRNGEEGYPGNLKVTVIYKLADDDALSIEYQAETDKATPVNLTNHSYFNLTGNVNNSILDHILFINADHYTPVDSSLIPTGEIKSVDGTPFDFSKPERIGARINQVKGGYDHNFVLNRKDNSVQPAAILSDLLSGRKLEVFTTEPGIQFYSGNFLNGSIKTSDGKPIGSHSALCLETQHFPDSPNEPGFPSTLLNPGEKYYSLTKYKISVLFEEN